jgi:hypothetical protein
MAKTRRRRARPSGEASAAPAVEEPTAAPERRRRSDRRPYIYAGFDFAFGAFYAFLLAQAPTRHATGAVLLWGTVAAVVLAGAGMVVRNRWGWRVAVAGCGALLLVTVALLVLVLLSASFLAGVYGSMGRGAATMAILAGAVIVELCGLLPAFQLKFLMTRAGRRWFGQDPLWQ